MSICSMSDSSPPLQRSDVVVHSLSMDGVTRVVSDLHLGHPGSLYGEVEDVYGLLDGVRCLILNGDTTEECSRALSPRSEEAFAAFCEEAGKRGIELVRLRGNHDASLDHLGALRMFGGKVLITHGDVCYHYGSPWSRWVPNIRDELDAVYEKFEKSGINTLEDRLQLAQAWAACVHPPVKRTGSKLAGIFGILMSAVWPPSVGWRLVKERILTIPKAVKFLDQFAPEVRVMIFGHIHRSGIWRRGSKMLINTGAYQPIAGRCVCDLDREGITVRSVVREEGRFVIGRTMRKMTWRSLGIDPLPDQGEV